MLGIIGSGGSHWARSASFNAWKISKFIQCHIYSFKKRCVIINDTTQKKTRKIIFFGIFFFVSIEAFAGNVQKRVFRFSVNKSSAKNKYLGFISVVKTFFCSVCHPHSSSYLQNANSAAASSEDEDAMLCDKCSLDEEEDTSHSKGPQPPPVAGRPPSYLHGFGLDQPHLPPAFPSGDESTGGNNSPALSIFHPSCSLSGSSSESSSKLSNPSLTQLTLDEDGRIRPYVCFERFLRNVEEGIANETIPKAQISLYK